MWEKNLTQVFDLLKSQKAQHSHQITYIRFIHCFSLESMRKLIANCWVIIFKTNKDILLRVLGTWNRVYNPTYDGKAMK